MKSFKDQVKSAGTFENLCVLAKMADAKEAVDAVANVRELMKAAEFDLGHNLGRLNKLALSFSSYGGRLTALNYYLDGQKSVGLDDAMALSEMVGNERKCVCDESSPGAQVTLAKIRKMAGSAMEASDETSLADLRKIIKVYGRAVCRHGKKDFLTDIGRVVKIAQPKIKTAEDAAATAGDIIPWEIVHAMLIEFLNGHPVQNERDAAIIMSATDGRAEGGDAFIDFAIRQFLANHELHFNIYDLISRTRGFGGSSCLGIISISGEDMSSVLSAL